MDNYVKPPNILVECKDMEQDWKKWKNDFMTFMKANNNMNKPECIKTHLLKYHLGTFGRNVIEKIISQNPKANDNLHVLLLELDKYFVTPINLVAERYNFFTSANTNESIEIYIQKLKEMADNCRFGKLRDSLVRDKIIAELKDKRLINMLISQKDLDLVSLISIYNNYRASMQQKKGNTLYDNKSNNELGTYKNDSSKNMPNHNRNCKRCDQRHAIRCCPAWGFKCEKCGQHNHFTHCCSPIFTKNKMKQSHINQSLNENHNDSMQNPSAPPLSDIDNVYPDIHDMDTAQRNMNKNTWTRQQSTSEILLKKKQTPKDECSIV